MKSLNIHALRLRQLLLAAAGLTLSLGGAAGCSADTDDEVGTGLCPDGGPITNAPFACSATLQPCEYAQYVCVSLDVAAESGAGGNLGGAGGMGGAGAHSCGPCVSEGCQLALREQGDFGANGPVCGPDPNVTDQCCYMIVSQLISGRPFMVGAEMRTAPLTQREDWCAALAARQAPAGVRAELCRQWQQDAQLEHASIASFARFALQLLALGAPAELVSGAQQAMGDEIRHAEQCFALASQYGETPCGPGPLAMDGALDHIDAAQLARELVREGCIGETLAVMVAAAAQEQASDAAVAEALAVIARDEAQHAALAYAALSWLTDRYGEPVRQSAARAFAAASAPESHAPDGLEAFGRLGGQALNEIARHTLSEVVAPVLGALLHGRRDELAA